MHTAGSLALFCLQPPAAMGGKYKKGARAGSWSKRMQTLKAQIKTQILQELGTQTSSKQVADGVQRRVTGKQAQVFKQPRSAKVAEDAAQKREPETKQTEDLTSLEQQLAYAVSQIKEQDDKILSCQTENRLLKLALETEKANSANLQKQLYSLENMRDIAGTYLATEGRVPSHVLQSFRHEPYFASRRLNYPWKR